LYLIKWSIKEFFPMFCLENLILTTNFFEKSKVKNLVHYLLNIIQLIKHGQRRLLLWLETWLNIMMVK